MNAFQSWDWPCYVLNPRSTLTLNGIVSLIKLMVNKGFTYLLPGILQSYKLEREFEV